VSYIHQYLNCKGDHIVMQKIVIAGLFCFLGGGALTAAQVEDGIYLRAEDDGGRRVELSHPTADHVMVGERIGKGFGEATMDSVANDNSQYVLRLRGAGPVSAGRLGQTALVIDGVALLVWGHTDPGPHDRVELSATIYDREAAERVAKRLGVEPRNRDDPGHRLTVHWSPDKPSYKVGEPVMLTMEIRNVGDVPVAFRVGGQQRGARDNQFRFIAHGMSGYGSGMPDTGDPSHHGGPSSRPVVKPGESFTKSVEVTRWFTFEKAGTYRITGIYELNLADPADERLMGPVLWEELVAGECTVRISD